MELLDETASGAVLGMSVPDTHLPLLKSMKVDYLKRTQGDLRAEATLTSAQRKTILAQDSGDVIVVVKVADSSGAEPIQVQMNGAWVPKRR